MQFTISVYNNSIDIKNGKGNRIQGKEGYKTDVLGQESVYGLRPISCMQQTQV